VADLTGIARVVGPLAVVLTAIAWAPVVPAGGRGPAVLVVVEDTLDARDPGQAVRAEERRADAILVLRVDRACGELSVTSVPRDLVPVPGSQPLAVLDETAGRHGVRRSVARVVHVSVVASITLRAADVEGLARVAGPVTVELPAASLDRNTGFQGGPGPTVIDASNVTGYLRSRAWEEQRDGEWAVVSGADQDRIGRLHTYLRSALPAVRSRGWSGLYALTRSLLARGRLEVDDPTALAAFLNAASRATALSLTSVPTVEERSVDARRSPFAPTDLGASHRLVPAPTNAGATIGCTGRGWA
jgi:hypothetical protein